MNEVRTSIKISRTVNWQWVWVGFCLLVTFHLVPTAFILGIFNFWNGSNIILPLWIFFGLALTSMYIGYRSTGVTIIEPLISSIAYLIVLGVAMNVQFGVFNYKKDFFHMLAWMVAGLFCSVLGAWIGELIQLKKEQRTAKTSV
jgi:hypothetical protein